MVGVGVLHVDGFVIHHFDVVGYDESVGENSEGRLRIVGLVCISAGIVCDVDDRGRFSGSGR